MSIEAVLQKHEDALMGLRNVQGVGIGEKAGRSVIKVFVSQKVPPSALPADQRIPETLEGCEVDVEEVGFIQAQSASAKEDRK